VGPPSFGIYRMLLTGGIEKFSANKNSRKIFRLATFISSFHGVKTIIILNIPKDFHQGFQAHIWFH